MGTKSLLRGIKAEKLATKYIQKIGYQVLCTNWKCPYGEIDLIGVKKGVLAFFEVKYRSSNDYGYTFESLNWSKISKLKKAIKIFLLQSHLFNSSWTLEGLCISPYKSKYTLTHFHNILDSN